MSNQQLQQMFINQLKMGNEQDHIIINEAPIAGGKKPIIIDKQKNAHPFCSIGAIFGKPDQLANLSNIFMGTGFVILGGKYVLTNGHIFIRPSNEYVTLTPKMFYPGHSGEITAETKGIRIVNFAICRKYQMKFQSISCKQYNQNLEAIERQLYSEDYTLLELEQTLPEYLEMNFGPIQFQENHYLFGYNQMPSGLNNNCKTYQFSGGFELVEAQHNFVNGIKYKITTDDGHSGSPIMIKANQKFKVVAIHKGSEKGKRTNYGFKLPQLSKIQQLKQIIANKSNKNKIQPKVTWSNINADKYTLSDKGLTIYRKQEINKDNVNKFYLKSLEKPLIPGKSYSITIKVNYSMDNSQISAGIVQKQNLQKQYNSFNHQTNPNMNERVVISYVSNYRKDKSGIGAIISKGSMSSNQKLFIKGNNEQELKIQIFMNKMVVIWLKGENIFENSFGTYVKKEDQLYFFVSLSPKSTVTVTNFEVK